MESDLKPMLSKEITTQVRYDKIIIIGYGFLDIEEAKTFKPSMVFPDEETNLID
jgi:aspartate 1-decarboxylase